MDLAIEFHQQLKVINDGYSLASLYKSTKVFVPATALSLDPKSRITLFGTELDAAINSLGFSSYDPLKNTMPQAANQLRHLGPSATVVTMGLAGFRVFDDVDRTLCIYAESAALSAEIAEQGVCDIVNLSNFEYLRLTAQPASTSKKSTRCELGLLSVDKIEVSSSQGLLYLGLMWPDIAQTLVASCDLIDLDARLKQFNNPRNTLLSSDQEKDPNPHLQVPKAMAARTIHAKAGVSN